MATHPTSPAPNGPVIPPPSLETVSPTPQHVTMPPIQHSAVVALVKAPAISLRDAERLQATGAILTTLPLAPSNLALVLRQIGALTRDTGGRLEPDTADVLALSTSEISAAPAASHTVSLTVDKDGYLVLHWSNPISFESNDRIALFDGDPNLAGVTGYLSNQWQWASRATSGSYTTGTKQNAMRPYWVAYLRYDQVQGKYLFVSTAIFPAAASIEISGSFGQEVIVNFSAHQADKYDWIGLYDSSTGRDEGNYIECEWAVNVTNTWRTGQTNGATQALTALYWAWSYSLGKYIDVQSAGPLAVNTRTCTVLTCAGVAVDRSGLLGERARYLVEWSPATYANPYDWVGIWDHDPQSADDDKSEEWWWAVNHPSGRIETNTEFDPAKTYWMAYCVYSYARASYEFAWKAPFRKFPHWMTDIAPKIRAKKLRELVLPASHDAGTYGITAMSSPSPDLPWYIRWPDEIPLVGRDVGWFVAAWSKTQNLNVTQQLELGYRCLDLRVAKWNDDFWICHGLYSVKLSEVLSAVQTFSRDNPREILLLVLSHYLDLAPGDYTTLVNKLKESLGTKLASRTLGLDATVEDFWNADTPIIVFSDGNIADPVIWNTSGVQVLYNEDQFHSADSVLAYLSNELKSPPQGKFWVLPLILTTDASVIASYLPTLGCGLALWTSRSAAQFTEFFQNPPCPLNIVAVDYVTGYPLVATAIQKNSDL